MTMCNYQDTMVISGSPKDYPNYAIAPHRKKCGHRQRLAYRRYLLGVCDVVNLLQCLYSKLNLKNKFYLNVQNMTFLCGFKNFLNLKKL